MVRRDQPFVRLAEHDELGFAREIGCDLGVVLAGEDDVGTRVGDDRPQLRRRETPVQRDDDRAELAGGEEELDNLEARAIQMCDARSLAHAECPQRLREPVRALVELGVRQDIVTGSDGDVVAAPLCMLAYDVGDADAERLLAHVSYRLSVIPTAAIAACDSSTA